jgi:hypothetical protein
LSAAAVLAAIDIINDVENQLALITFWTGNFCLFIERVLVMGVVKQDIKHQRDSSLKWDSE